MRTILLDKQQESLDTLGQLIESFDSVNMIGKYKELSSLIPHIQRQEVDVLFLNYNQKASRNFEIATKLLYEYPDLKIVFISDDMRYAIQAFEINITDYIIKPVHKERLEKTIMKLESRLGIECLGASQGLYVRAFGCLHVLDTNENPVKWRTRKVKELFALLWNAGCKPVHKEKVIDCLWGDLSYNRASMLLNTTVYQLRKQLKSYYSEQVVILKNGHYTLCVPIQSDYEELHALLKSPATVENIKKIISIDQSSLLEDYHWALKAKELLTMKYINYLEEQVFIDNNQITEQVKLACLKRLYELDPYNKKYVEKLLSRYGSVSKFANETLINDEYKMNLVDLGIKVSESIEDELT